MPELTLPSILSDEMVLQRGRSNPVWGWDRPGQRVTLSVEGVFGPEAAGAGLDAARPSATAVASADGSFRLACPELPAGGPYRLRISGSTERVIDRVLVGEVWLASGQSNMEWKVSQAKDAEREIAAAQWPEIRMFTAARLASRDPSPIGGGRWRTCHPDTAHDFSAVGYYFARELHRELKVPVGIIDASWGGTPIEAWMSIGALRAVMDIDAELSQWSRPASEVERIRVEYEAAMVRWEAECLPNDTSNEGEAKGWARVELDEDGWPSMPVPGAWQTRGLKFNGAVWFRKTIELDASWSGHDLSLSLGAIDDFDHTYFNGEKVGAHPKGTPGAFQIHRLYRIPGALVRPGKNVVAVRVFDHVGEGGFVGPAGEMFLETTGPDRSRVSLVGVWRYQVERRIPLVSFDVFRTCPAPPSILVQQNSPAALFGGMIAPLVPFGLRGVIWYQGESNVEQHRLYAERMVAMIRDFRAQFGQVTMPFYLTQLANYIASPAWACLREAQADALCEPSTGMAVTIDIGDRDDIHPRNKQEVGRRLSLLALARTYGRREVEDSGPALERVVFGEGNARAYFSHAAGLRARGGGNEVKGFTIAGVDGVHHSVVARIEGDTILLTSARVPAPKSVRYAWADNPDADLENGAALPAAPFRTARD
jgi:sialate O-acetylesterase